MANPTRGLRIGELARRASLAPSAIRYYEQAGLLQPPARVGGKRLYDPMTLHCLRIIVTARRAGFSMAEIRQLAARFAPGASPADRWRTLAREMLAEADRLAERADRLRAAARVTTSCAPEPGADCLAELSTHLGHVSPPRR